MASESKRILLTGATRGLGLAMTEEFIARGHTIAGCGTRRELVEKLRQRFGAPHTFHVVDVSSDEQVGRWARDIDAVEQPPDLVINNAALINVPAPLWEAPADEFARLMQVNVNGVFHVIRHFVPAMVRRGSGVIVNFSSGWGRSVAAEAAPYCATKWAIEGLTRALAEELPRGMAAVPLNPGVINTDMLQVAFADSASEYQSPAEWAQKAVPLLLGLGAKDNGQPLAVRS
ncbi:MAG: SDR family oxidoreductase [Pirellulales bacterium]|nr:SDR family oxidoreductase [Pirellulales bacterium]